VRFVLAVDADEAGQKLEAELARRIGVERCARVVWPEGCKDANDTLMAHGAERVRALIETASPYPVAGILSIAEHEESVWGLYTDGLRRGMPTGWAALDALYTVRPGEFTAVTGEPGSGKSAWADNLAVNMARLHDWRIGIYSPENQPVARHIAMLAAKYVGMPFADGPTPRMGTEQVDAALRWLDERFAFILPDEPTVEAVLALARVLVYRMGIRGLIIDPWNELDHARPASLSETEYISRSLTLIRRFARANGVHVWVVAHPTKLIKGANGKYPVATPYDIAGSAHWYNKADNAISVYRDKDEPAHPSAIHVQKIRFGEVGRIGAAELRYDVPTGRFLDVPPPVAHAWRGGEA
jgi:twinkle protein